MLREVERYRGALLGLAAGDALGTTLEFKPPGTFEPISEIVGGGPFGLEPGEWTDDTSMSLCLAESLIECRGFDPIDQLKRYVDWMENGHLSSTGECFDIGNTTAAALYGFQRTGKPCGQTGEYSAGNGSIMRLAPVPMFYANDRAKAIEYGGRSSATTHAADETIGACRYMADLIVLALRGASKEEISSPPSMGGLPDRIEKVANGSFKIAQPPEIRGTGYVVDSLEAALWAFWNSDNFADGARAGGESRRRRRHHRRSLWANRRGLLRRPWNTRTLAKHPGAAGQDRCLCHTTLRLAVCPSRGWRVNSPPYCKWRSGLLPYPSTPILRSDCTRYRMSAY